MRHTRVRIPQNLFLLFWQNPVVFKLSLKVNRTLEIKGDGNLNAFVIAENQNNVGSCSWVSDLEAGNSITRDM